MKNRRENSGSILAFGLILFGLALTIFLFPCLDLVMLTLLKQQERTALDAAALIAARDLGKIVIRDSYFGYLSLSDYPPTGKATIASDGEPLPVIGMNTLWATCRNEMLVAKALGSDKMHSLALRDMAEARRASADLQAVLVQALKPNSKQALSDIDGNLVTPFADAMRYLQSTKSSQLPMNTKITNFSLTIGWLSEPCDSGAAIPQPASLAYVSEDQQVGTNYRAFVNVPVGSDNFYFAATPPQTKLVNASGFRSPDGTRICSVVKGDLDVSFPIPVTMQKGTMLYAHAESCAEPAAHPDLSAPGAMSVIFPDGLCSGMPTLRALICNDGLKASYADSLTATGGDFAIDGDAVMTVKEQSDANCPISDIIACSVFDWLRTFHGRERLDSVIATLDTPFKNNTSASSGNSACNLLYELDRDGDLTVINQKISPFPPEVVSENQMRANASDAFQVDQNTWSMNVRDEVRNLGITTGGKHAGQPIAGNPINWCELSTYGGTPALAASKCQGGASRGFMVVGTPLASIDGISAIDLTSARFVDNKLVSLKNQPRKSFYAGGLAVEIKFYCPTASNS